MCLVKESLVSGERVKEPEKMVQGRPPKWPGRPSLQLPGKGHPRLTEEDGDAFPALICFGDLEVHLD